MLSRWHTENAAPLTIIAPIMAATATQTPDTTADWDLENLSDAKRLCDWMFEQYADAVRGTVAEIGAGVGTFSERLRSDAGVDRLVLLEPDERCFALLKSKFADDGRVMLAQETIPGSTALETVASECDLVLCQNVLEHIEDDYGAVRAMAQALKPGGELVILVPAHPRLFGSLDERFGHFRRYDRARLRDTIESSGLEIERLGSFNLLGIPGWYVKSRGGAESLGTRALAVYETLVRLWRPIEQRLEPRWGLSLVARARKPTIHE